MFLSVDIFVLTQDHPSQAFFAIFDGHGGLEASVYSSSQVHCRLAKQPNLQTNPKMALKQAFVETDEWFVAKAKREVLYVVWYIVFTQSYALYMV